MSCNRSDEFIGNLGAQVRETIDAKKTRFGPDDLDEVFAGATKVVAARGKKVVTFKPGYADDREAMTKAVIGPSGNLRAPVARVGKTFLVGFNEDMWSDVLG